MPFLRSGKDPSPSESSYWRRLPLGKGPVCCRSTWVSFMLLLLPHALPAQIPLTPVATATPEMRKPGERWLDPVSGIEFVWIPAGSFVMGSPENELGRSSHEGPQKTIRISNGFWLGRTEVTQSQWIATMGTRDLFFKGFYSSASPSNPPADNIRWEDAEAFTQKLNDMVKAPAYRLPTEAEWEYACRAGTITSTYGSLKSIAWFVDNSSKRSHLVGAKQPNALGLYDMIGNVWEWCSDWYGEGTYSTMPDVDPSGPESGPFHVLRGGSWRDKSQYCRAATRYSFMPDPRYEDIGFRIVCLLTPANP